MHLHGTRLDVQRRAAIVSRLISHRECDAAALRCLMGAPRKPDQVCYVCAFWSCQPWDPVLSMAGLLKPSVLCHILRQA